MLTTIIVNYNVRHFLEQCLLSVRKANPNGALGDVWVVDNNSSDDSVAMVRQHFPEVQLIANQQNTGFAVANNQAIRESAVLSPQSAVPSLQSAVLSPQSAASAYVLLLNPDTVVAEDTLTKCLDFMEAHPEAGGLGVKMIDGSGTFLPESKRGFTTPWVAFCKTFGLSAIFPKSRLFGRYHLGFLDKNETHEVDVLAGAFMLLRRSVLDKIGLLDEAFFMYGEDIDLSYRIVQAGYQNYYFADTAIIHYKGESTKKGSLNYVRTFYQAMIIFARKHFQGRQATLFVAMIYGAIWLRAGMTLLGNFFKKSQIPVLDALLMFSGLWLSKTFWASYFYHDPDWFKPEFMQFNAPFYTLVWLASLWFSGGYDEPFNLRRLTRGLLLGTVVISAVYGFLPQDLRPSRAVILLGTAWALLALTALRFVFHFFKTGNLSVGRSRLANLAIVGSAEECERVRGLLAKAGVERNFIGRVAPNDIYDLRFTIYDCLGAMDNLDELAALYHLDEIIFCLKDITASQTIGWMERLGPRLEYRTVPEGGQTIIGSSSKDSAGELYTTSIRFNIANPTARRSKRLLDLGLAFCFLLLAVPLLFLVKKPGGFLRNLVQVFLGKKSWVGYSSWQTTVHSPQSGPTRPTLPRVKQGVLNPVHAFPGSQLDEATAQRLDFFYAKDYEIGRDLAVMRKGWRELGG
ncbi:MAG: glycosyltransferase [Saprospiraceae bacterium]|jgi:GT2 family glycosyltransferase|nr:glycosyltransferase [Saprospiraceae bacterium]